MQLNAYSAKDEQLYKEVQKLLDGQYDSYQNVYELSHKYIYKVIYDIVQDHHVTEDMMQETYLQVYNKISTLRDAKAFYVWAGRIASNMSLRYLQKYRQEVLIDNTADDGADFIFEQAVNDNEEFIPETVLENEEQQRIIAGILEGLSPEQKLTVQYYYYEELSVNEIAGLMNCSPGTVKSRLNYARKSLKDAIGQFEMDNGVKLYSLANLPIFFLLCKGLSESLVFTGAAAGAAVAGGIVGGSGTPAAIAGGSVGAAGGSAGVAGGGIGAAGGAGVSGGAGAGIVGSAGAAGAVSTGSAAGATFAAKALIVAVTVAVSVGTSAAAAEVAENNMIVETGHVITKEEALGQAVVRMDGELAANLLTDIFLGGTDYRSETETPDHIVYESTEPPRDTQKSFDYDALEEFLGDTEEELYISAGVDVDEEYLTAVNSLAEQLIRYWGALEYSLTEEQNAYIDQLMAGYVAEVQSYFQQGISYAQLMEADEQNIFRDRYFDDLLDLIDQEAEVIGSLADIYSKEEVKTLLANHTVEELESVMEAGGGVGDLIAMELSEGTLNELLSATEEYFDLLNHYMEWAETMSNDPDMAAYFQSGT